jgi:hypothetical protein
LKVFKLGRAQADGASFKVHLLDVSQRGARLHASEAPDRGIHLELTCASVSTSGTVRWVDARRFGIRFDAALAPSELASILATSGSAEPTFH